MYIEFDGKKEAANQRKHGFSFALAREVFRDPRVITAYDRFAEHEHRWRALGRAGQLLLHVVYTFPDEDDDERIRVIGLRKATSRERMSYEQRDFD